MRRAGLGTKKRKSNSVLRWSCDALTFHAIWIIPEVSLTQKLDMVCGSVEMKWSCLPNTISDTHISRTGRTCRHTEGHTGVLAGISNPRALHCALLSERLSIPTRQGLWASGTDTRKRPNTGRLRKGVVESLLGHCRDLARRAAGLVRSDMLLSPYII
jgi:hypothetical protein